MPRKRTNSIFKLQDEAGSWVTKPEDLCNLAVHYFMQVFDGPENYDPPNLHYIEHRISEDQNAQLTAPFTSDEFNLMGSTWHSTSTSGP